MRNVSSLIVVAFLFGVQIVSAQLLSVDINGPSGDANKGANKPGYQPWYLADQTGANIISATRSFTNYVYVYDTTNDPYGPPIATNISLIIPCTVKMTSPSAASTTNYLFAKAQNKAGYSTSTDPNDKWRLCVDGVMSYWKDDNAVPKADQPNTNGGAISLTISNLPAGDHTFTTYHNNPWAPPQDNAAWHSGLTNMSRYIISVNDVAVFTNVPSFGCTNDNLCSSAFFHVTNSYDGQPVKIDFKPDGSGQLDFVILNGFEIDRPFAPGMEASLVYPLSGDEHAFANNDQPLPNSFNSGHLSLQWTPATFAISNYIYFGTNLNSVATATMASPEFKQSSAAIIGATNSFSVSNLNSVATYYWRVDQLDIANGATNVVPGTVASFRTRHLAFPTAEGYGRWARGGRGGVVIEVTNLNDSGPGSYRAAIEASGPRTVVFRVSGLIQLQSPCVIGNGYLTVAGQTAPGDGICIANYRAGMGGCNDVIMRFMRCRLGDAAKKAMDGIGLGNATHSIIDHTTISWTMDEGTSSRQSGPVGSESAMITFQHNLISEPLRYSYHYSGQSATSTNYEPHAFAGSISGEIGSYHHNFIAHSTDRNWSLAGGYDQTVHYAGSLDIRNNVVYNWRGRTTDGGVARLNYVNNYYKPAPVNLSISASWLLKLDPINTNVGYTVYYYMTNNVWQGKGYYTNNWVAGSFYNGLPLANLVVTNSEIFPSYVDTQSASNAYKVVLSDSGCNLQLQDAIDRRVIGEALDGTTHYIGTNGNPYIVNGIVQPTGGADNPGFIDSQNDVFDFTNNPAAPNYSPNAPWPPYNTYNVPVDSDHDGLPDWWEQIKGLNPNSPAGDFSDANADLLNDGYTELERYLSWLAQPHYTCTNGTALSVDLAQYTRGFTNASLGSSYAVFAATNGSVTLSGKTAQFNATATMNALGGFLFKVTDNTGFSYTNTVNVRIVVPTTNTAPVLPAISNRAINAGVNLLITNAATDADVPAQTLVYSLPVAPTNATIGAASGVLNWRPLVTQSGTTNPFSVVVTDNGSPSMSATQSFSVVVNPLTQPNVSTPLMNAGQVGFSVDGQVGPDYAVQGSTNLVDWNTLLITNPATMPFTWTTNTSGSALQFYRIKLGPPLP